MIGGWESVSRDSHGKWTAGAINKWLNDGTARASDKALVASMDSAIAKTQLPAPLTVFRGMSERLDRVQVGAVIKDKALGLIYMTPVNLTGVKYIIPKAFISTSSDPRIAVGFATGERQATTIAQIELPKGARERPEMTVSPLCLSCGQLRCLRPDPGRHSDGDSGSHVSD